MTRARFAIFRPTIVAPKGAREVGGALRPRLHSVRPTRGGTRGPGRPRGVAAHVVSVDNLARVPNATRRRIGETREADDDKERNNSE